MNEQELEVARYNAAHLQFLNDEIKQLTNSLAAVILHLNAEGFEAYVSDMDLEAAKQHIMATYDPTLRLTHLEVTHNAK